MKNIKLYLFQILALSSLFVISVFGNTVSLDTTFNGTGYNLLSPAQTPLRATASSSAIQADGKIVIGGEITDTSVNQDVGFLVMRLNADGTLDTSFGTNGSTITPIDLSAEAAKLLIQPDGKILLAGTSFAVETEYNFTVIRYNTDGSLDTSFNGTGYSVKGFSDGRSYDECNDMVLQPDGKIVLVGRTGAIPWTGPFIDFNFAVMRLNTDGSFDTTFNGTGKLAAGTQQDVNESAGAVIIDREGKIIAGGIHNNSPNHQNFLLMRFESNGTLDTTFGSNGTVSTSVDNTLSGFVKTMALQSDGKILAGGNGNAIVRYTADGVLDTTFGVNGKARAPNSITSIRMINGDRFLATVWFGVLRYLKNGGQDTEFQFNATISGNDCHIYSVDIDSSNKILLSGNCYPGSNFNSNKIAMFRVKETLTKRYLDFLGGGKTAFSLYRPSVSEWFPSPGRPSVLFGLNTDRIVPADYTGDGIADIAVFRPSTGEWMILRSENGTFYSVPFGIAEDNPVPADYDGDQIDDIAVFRPSDNTWYIQKSTGGIRYENFGLAGDKLVPSDYDGDFTADIAIYRPSSGQWWIHRSSDDSIYAFQFGTADDRPVMGDYTGDNKTDAAFWRPSTGEWFILRSEDFSYYSFPWGLSDDLPTPGNYSGDARFDAAVYRPSTNRWYVLTAEGNIIQNDIGISGDRPIPNYFVP